MKFKPSQNFASVGTRIPNHGGLSSHYRRRRSTDGPSRFKSPLNSTRDILHLLQGPKFDHFLATANYHRLPSVLKRWHVTFELSAYLDKLVISLPTNCCISECLLNMDQFAYLLDCDEEMSNVQLVGSEHLLSQA